MSNADAAIGKQGMRDIFYDSCWGAAFLFVKLTEVYRNLLDVGACVCTSV
jgi:hypothetical protein